MKKVALAIAAMLVLLVVAPAFSQPFADVPTDHWAFDAIAELAAKGIIEGYPDGTFKGDRALTRYEMAMVIARVLARIEAIKIPPPPAPVKIPPPEVTRADIQTLQRLINEFRAELAALGVRVTAVEEELTALKARVDNTFITGDWAYVYQFQNWPYPFVARNRVRLTFRGRVGSHVSLFLRARFNNIAPTNFLGQGCNGAAWPAGGTCIDFDRLYLDYSAPFGVVFRVGRDYWGLGDNQLLLNSLISREGVRATGSFGPLSLTALTYFQNTNTAFPFWNGPTSVYAFRAQASLIPGWTFGVNFRADRNTWKPNWVAFNGTGWSFDWSGDIIPGLTFSGEYASFVPLGGCPAAGGIANVQYGCTALFANLAIDLGRLTGMTAFSPMANLWYKNYQAYYTTNNTNIFTIGAPYWMGAAGRRVTAWGGDLSIKPITNLTLGAGVESGRANTGFCSGFLLASCVFTGNAYVAWIAYATYALGHNGTVSLEYYNQRNTTLATSEGGAAVVVRTRW